MSTLQVGTIKSSDSSAPVFQNSSGTEKGQLAKAWCNMNCQSTPAFRDSFNFSSITDHGTGDFELSFTTAMANANYAVSGSNVGATSNSFSTIFGDTSGSPVSNQLQTGSVRFKTPAMSNALTLQDTDFIHCVIHGD